MLDTSPAAPGLTPQETPYKKKLIEVALPLQAINAASAREKSIRHGHPSTLHLWWARRPLAACRAVLFASLVDDPSSHPERFPTSEEQERERKRLFDLIEQLVQWENSLSEHVLAQAREEIRKSVGDDLPTVYDPFCGGGAIPIEAQRLGLPTLASDLNPVAVLITKALTEIPWRFKGRTPVHPSFQGPLHERTWERATGLAADVEAYGKWMVDQARKRLNQFYPSASLTGAGNATVIAWLWARTVRCPNPLCGADMPLIRSFVLSAKRGKEFYLEPIIDFDNKTIRYEPRSGVPTRNGTISRRGALCIVCNEPVSLAYIRSEGKAKRTKEQMTAIVAEGPRGRIYLAPDQQQQDIAHTAQAAWAPDTDLVYNPRHMSPPLYGMTKHRDLFTPRQLLALTTFSDLVRECHQRVLSDAIASGLLDDGEGLESGGSAAEAYADAVATYLAFVVDRIANYSCSLCSWHTTGEKMNPVFIRQSVSMVWDFAECNPLSDSSGNADGALDWIVKTVQQASCAQRATVFLRDASDGAAYPDAVVSTDPPYYDNVPYSDLSDFFYTWLRASVSQYYPETLATILTPKSQELVADPIRFAGSREEARSFFERGLTRVFTNIAHQTGFAIPTTLFYAFKQREMTESNGGSDQESISEGWESMLSALMASGLQVVATWPVTTEQRARIRSVDSNALASSIVLSCRPRDAHASKGTRTTFLKDLRAELPIAVKRLREASLAATDLEQAAIGPGMAVFSRYASVLETDGSPMTVRSALALINQELAQVVLGELADVDAETHFALSWFKDHFYSEAKFGEAEVLLKAKNANLGILEHLGVATAEKGLVRLNQASSLRALSADVRINSMPAWAQLMHLIAALESEDGGELPAAEMLKQMGADRSEQIKDLAYHCYLVCDRAKRSTEAQDFNTLVATWPDLQKRAARALEDRLL